MSLSNFFLLLNTRYRSLTVTRGFTLIEVMLVIALLVIIGGISAPVYQVFQNTNNLNVASNTIVQTLRRSQVLSQSSDGDSTWGTHIVIGNIILFKGLDYASRDSSFDEIFEIPTNITPSGISEVVFSKVVGLPNLTGDIILTASSGDVKTVSVNSKGMLGISSSSAPQEDITPPVAVANLATSSPTINSVNLSWTSPGDDGSTGTATSYDVRYSTSIITEGNWGTATQATGEPVPQIAGSSESMIVSGLSSNTTYYFAIKTSDEIPNISAISNSPSGTTTGGVDTTPPAAVTNLATSSASGKSILLTWTAPGDDGSTGTATSYDIRYSTSAITEGNWAAATQVSGEPAPQVAGTVQTMRVNGLNWNTTYFFAIKTSDEVPNISTISNSPSLITRTQASYLVVNTATARSNAPTDNSQLINITIQNTSIYAEEILTINQMSATWSGGGNRRINTIRIDGTNYWTGTASKGTLVTLSPAFPLSSTTTYPITYIDYNNSIIGSTGNIISFVMADGSTLDSSSFNITQ